MDQNGTTFLFFRCIFGLWFVLQGLAQTDYVGPRLFPTLNEHFVSCFFVIVCHMQ